MRGTILTLFLCVLAVPLPADTPEFLFSWGRSGTGDELLVVPRDIEVGSDGLVYVLDHYKIKVFDTEGQLLRSWGNLGTGSGDLALPEGFSLGPEGDVFVADTPSDLVKRFSATGAIKSAFAGGGDGVLPLYRPTDVAATADQLILVTDPFRHRIQVLNYGGQLVRSWKTDPLDVSEPNGLSLAADGTVYVALDGTNRIRHYDVEGNLLGEFGGQGTSEGKFRTPAGVDVTDDAVYVADHENHRVQVFSRDGIFDYAIGEEGEGDGQFRFPVGVAVGDDGSVYVADQGNRRIQKFGTPVAAAPVTWGSLKRRP